MSACSSDILLYYQHFCLYWPISCPFISTFTKQITICLYFPCILKYCLYGEGAVRKVPSMYISWHLCRHIRFSSVVNTRMSQSLSWCKKKLSPDHVSLHVPSIVMSSTVRGTTGTCSSLVRVIDVLILWNSGICFRSPPPLFIARVGWMQARRSNFNQIDLSQKWIQQSPIHLHGTKVG